MEKRVLFCGLMQLFMCNAFGQPGETVFEAGVNVGEAAYVRNYSRYGSHGVAGGLFTGLFGRISAHNSAFRWMVSYTNLAGLPAVYVEFGGGTADSPATHERTLVTAGFGVQKSLYSPAGNPRYLFFDMLYLYENWKGETYLRGNPTTHPARTLTNGVQLLPGIGHNYPLHDHWNLSVEAAIGITAGLSQLHYEMGGNGIRDGSYFIMPAATVRCRLTYIW